MRLMKLLLVLIVCAAGPALASPLLGATSPVPGPYQEGWDAYDRKDYAAALRLWRSLPEVIAPTIQLNLGFMYLNGLGAPQDYAEAIRWFSRAAEQGEVVAQAALGAMYQNGQGAPQDYVQAHKWFNIAASKVSSSSHGTYRELFDETVKARDGVAAKMTPAQVAEAQKLAREWKPKLER